MHKLTEGKDLQKLAVKCQTDLQKHSRGRRRHAVAAERKECTKNKWGTGGFGASESLEGCHAVTRPGGCRRFSRETEGKSTAEMKKRQVSRARVDTQQGQGCTKIETATAGDNANESSRRGTIFWTGYQVQTRARPGHVGSLVSKRRGCRGGDEPDSYLP
jgi:hypothetical protein